MNMKFIKSPTAVAMVALVVIVGGAVGLAVYALHKDDQNDRTSGTSTSDPSSKAPAANQKTSDSQSPQPPAPMAGATPGTTPQPGVTTTPPVASASATSITIGSTAFSPANITVKKGTAVTWTNKDTADHGIMESDDLAGPHSPLLKPNNSYIYTFNTVGTYHYRDAITPALTGTVTVTN